MIHQHSGNIYKLNTVLDENLDHFVWSMDAICRKKGICDIQDEISLAILHGHFYHSKFGEAEGFKKAISYFEAAIILAVRLLHCIFRHCLLLPQSDKKYLEKIAIN